MNPSKLLFVILAIFLNGCQIWTVPRHFDFKLGNNTTSWSLRHFRTFDTSDKSFPYLELSGVSIVIIPGEWLNINEPKNWKNNVTWLYAGHQKKDPAFLIKFCISRNPYIPGPNLIKLDSIEDIEMVRQRDRFTAKLRGVGPITRPGCYEYTKCINPPEVNPSNYLTLTGHQERCYYLDFPIETPPGNQEFQLRMPSLIFDGIAVSVPVLNYKYVSTKYHSCFLAGCLVSH